MRKLLQTGIRPAAWCAALALGVAMTLGAGPSQANEVRISYQFGLGFLAEMVALEQKLIEKHARALGVSDIKVTGRQLSGAAITNDALLAGNIDVAAGGIGGVLNLWSKTNGKIKAMVSINDMALLLNSNDPSIKSVTDYVGISDHKIALPAVKVGLHAIVLQMAAEQQLGEGRQYELDSLTISLPHPDGLAALTSGRSEIKSHFTSLPFAYLELQSREPPVHNVLSSYDVLGGAHTNLMLYTKVEWVEANPKLAQAVFDAIVEAEQWINANPQAAARLYKEFSRSTLALADLEAIISDKKLVDYVPQPRATMKFAEFYTKIGRLQEKPASWKDYFLDMAHHLDGS
jgi:NitT/TauT family transport system substrate-binding protein